MSKQDPASPSAKNKGADTALIHTFLENQKIELNNSAQEIELRKVNEKNGFTYSCRALDAQKDDREKRREQVRFFVKIGSQMAIFFTLLIGLGIWYLVSTGNISVIISILKVMAYIVPSSLGGYFIGMHRGKNNPKSTPPNSYAEVVN